MFWEIHNPTTLNRQGPDVGTQYRSAIFVDGTEQRQQAINSKNKLEKSGRYNLPITTEIIDAVEFYPAEECHQKYAEKHGDHHC